MILLDLWTHGVVPFQCFDLYVNSQTAENKQDVFVFSLVKAKRRRTTPLGGEGVPLWDLLPTHRRSGLTGKGPQILAAAVKPTDFIGLIGTTEVVPRYKTPAMGVFPQPVQPLFFIVRRWSEMICKHLRCGQLPSAGPRQKKARDRCWWDNRARPVKVRGFPPFPR